MNKRIAIIALAVLLLFCSAIGVYWYLWNKDGREHADFSAELTILSEASERSLQPGESFDISYCVENSGYNYATVREYVLVSLFDSEGKTVCYDSMQTTVADLALSGENVTTVAVQDHQIIYSLGEYPLAAAQPRYYNPFAEKKTPPQGYEMASCKRRNELILSLADNADARYTDLTVCVEIFVEQKMEDDWKLLFAKSLTFGNAAISASGKLPDLNATASLAWDIHGEEAWVTGIGTTLERDIVIPSEVYLSVIVPQEAMIFASEVRAKGYFTSCGEAYAIEAADGSIIDSQEHLLQNNVQARRLHVYDINAVRRLLKADEFPPLTMSLADGTQVSKSNFRSFAPSQCSREEPYVIEISAKGERVVEDPIAGTRYSVLVTGNAFADCEQVRSVRFLPGVQVLGGAMYRSDRGMFSNCSNLEAVYNIPETVHNMEDAFLGCVSMKTAPILPQSVTSLGDTFQGCTAMEEGPAIPDSVTNMSGTFRGCTALKAAYIGENVSNIQNCFNGCVSLENAPKIGTSVVDMNAAFRGCVLLKHASIGENVTDLRNCFEGCTALQSAPKIPETVKDIAGAFANCTALSGMVEIPSCKEMNAVMDSIETAFSGCEKIGTVTVQYCEDSLYRFEKPETLELIFVGDHVADGICTNCHAVSKTTKVDGLEVVFDLVSQELYEELLNYLDNEVPDFLKETCGKLTFTNDLKRFSSKYGDERYTGYAHYPSGTAYVKALDDALHDTLIHELAHCYDHNFSNNGRISASNEWRELHSLEGGMALLHYNNIIFNELSDDLQRKETFAIAVALYFTEPNGLRNQSPQMFAYLEKLFQTTA